MSTNFREKYENLVFQAVKYIEGQVLHLGKLSFMAINSTQDFEDIETYNLPGTRIVNNSLQGYKFDYCKVYGIDVDTNNNINLHCINMSADEEHIILMLNEILDNQCLMQIADLIKNGEIY